MAFWVNNQKFLNYEEQVLKNKEDIEDIKTNIGMELPFRFKVWRSGDEIFNKDNGNVSRTFIVIFDGQNDEIRTVEFLTDENIALLWDDMQATVSLTSRIFYIVYDESYSGGQSIYVNENGVMKRSNYFLKSLTLKSGENVALLEIII